MHLFEVVASDGTILPVFAENYDHAVAVFTAYHAASGVHLLDFEVRRRNPRWPGLNTAHVLDALAREVAGVGTYDAANGWAIIPPFDQQGR